jgi:hypothetical protein
MCPIAGEACVAAFPWYDLPPELRKAILARVPLLRLAQLAVQCRDFRAVYRRRLDAQKRDEASLPYPLTQPVHRLFWWYMSFNSLHPGSIDQRPWEWFPDFAYMTNESGNAVGLPWEGVVRKTSVFIRRLFSKAVRARIYARYMAEGSLLPCSATVELRCSMKTRGRCRKLAGTKLLINCSDTPDGVAPIFGIVMGMEVACAVRRFLDFVAGGDPDGLPRKGVAGPVERVRLLLPKSCAWPEVEGGKEISDGITSILANARGRPSGVQIRVNGRRRDADTWELPCVVHRGMEVL